VIKKKITKNPKDSNIFVEEKVNFMILPASLFSTFSLSARYVGLIFIFWINFLD